MTEYAAWVRERDRVAARKAKAARRAAAWEEIGELEGIGQRLLARLLWLFT